MDNQENLVNQFNHELVLNGFEELKRNQAALET